MPFDRWFVRWTVLGIILSSISLWPCVVNAASDLILDQQLAETDQLRSADRVKFNQKLQLLQQARQEMNAHQQAYLSFLLAYRDTIEGKHEQATTTLEALLTEHIPLELKFRTAITLAQAQVVRRQFMDAFAKLTMAMNWQRQLVDSPYVAEGTLAAVNIFNEAGLYEQSQSYLQMLQDNQLTPRTRCIRDVFYIQNQRQLAKTTDLAFAEASFNQCQQSKQTLIAGFAGLQILYTLLAQQDAPAAFERALELQPLMLNTKYPRLLAEYYQVSATAALRAGLVDKAEQQVALALKNGEQAPNSTPVVAAFKLAAELAAQKQDFAKAYSYMQAFAQAEQIVHDEKSVKLLAYQMAMLDSARKNMQVAIMQQQLNNSELQAQLQQERELRDQVALGGLLLVLVVLCGLMLKLLNRHHYYKQVVETDSTTLLTNQNYFTRHSEQLLRKKETQQQAVGLILFEIDQFHIIQEQHGPLILNKVLQTCVHICSHFIRSQDLFSRLNDETFAIFLPDCQADKVTMLAEICRDAIEHADAGVLGVNRSISASFGIATHLTAGYQRNELQKQAEQALGTAKLQGGNQVLVFEAAGETVR